MIGEVIGHFEIQAELGRGGMARVYKAWDRVLNRHVAVKVLTATPGDEPFAPPAADYARILHEARAASRLDHPNIAPVYQVFTAGSRAVLVMQLINGPSLRQRLAEGPIPLEEARWIALSIARGLAEAHRSGVLHRDIKPENIMLTDRGEVKLTDFGIARVGAADSGTVTTSIRGTPGYLPPEVLNGLPHDARGDVFSAGVTFYELFAGGHPFARPTTAATLTAILNESPPWLSEILPGFPVNLSRIVGRAMTKDPANRFADATGLLEALESETPMEWRPSPSGTLRPVPRGAARRKQARQILILGAAAAMIAAGVTGWRLMRRAAPSRWTVTGQVTDTSGMPVSGALVTMDGHAFQARTSSDGRFQADVVDAVAGEPVLVRISHDRYVTHTDWIELDDDRAESLHVALAPID